MKTTRILFTIFIAVVSSAATLLVFQKFQKQPVVSIENRTPAQFSSLPAYGTSAQPIDFKYAASQATPAVVHIKSIFEPQKVNYRGNNPFQDFFGDDFQNFFHGPNPYQRQPQVGTGSGVIISPDGYVVTNNHVIENANEITVVMNNNKSFKAKVIGTDSDTDIALLKVEGENLPSLAFTNSDSVLVGEWVLAVGNPFNLASTVTAGIVSAKGRNINLLGENMANNKKTAIESFIQTDAAVNPGNSGGALVNINGELVGINTAIASPTGSYAGYSFAVPANIVNKVVLDLKKFGVSQRGFIGISMRSMDDELAKDLGLDKPFGVYVDAVNSGSAASEAGLKSKDVITKINGFTVNSAAELQEQIAKYSPGDKVSIEYLRSGDIRTASAVLKNKFNTVSTVDKTNNVMDELGVTLQPLTASEAAQMGVRGGVRVSDIKPGKISEFTDIKKGFIITQVDDQEVKSESDFINILKEKQGRVLLEGIYPNKPMSYLYAFKM